MARNCVSNVCKTRAMTSIPYDQNIENLKSVFLKSVEAVQPDKLIRENISRYHHMLKVYDKSYYINKNCYVIGFGKAVFKMSLELETILGRHLVWGVVSIPLGTLSAQSAPKSSRIMYMEGAENNLPDRYSAKAAHEIADLTKNLTANDILFVLISGGGSALLPAPIPEISLAEKCKLIKLLSKRGADVIELNSVRKRLSKLKGGGLAELAYPANVITLILSDVIGDPIDFIASGPTVPNIDPPEFALNVFDKYTKDIPSLVPKSIQKAMHSQACKDNSSGAKIIDGTYAHVRNILIGNNKIAVEKAAERAKDLGFEVVVMSDSITGDVTNISAIYSEIAAEIIKVLNLQSSKGQFENTLQKYQHTLNLSTKVINTALESLNFDSINSKCFIFAGEPTVNVKGHGIGGRNQQLALQFSLDMQNYMQNINKDYSSDGPQVYLLSCGTDGIDGPTDAAGAIGFNGIIDLANKFQMDIEKYIENNDSYNFYKFLCQGRYLIKTGHTGTNVMDIHVLVVKV